MSGITLQGNDYRVCHLFMRTAFLFLFLIVLLPSVNARKLRVACVQMPIEGNVRNNLVYMSKALDEAIKNRARVVVFPETSLSGFFEEDLKKLEMPELNRAMAELSKLAKDKNIYIIYGTITPSPSAKPYNTAIALNPEGKVVETYHKTFPEGYFEPGERLALFSVDSIPATMIICHDSRYPELVRVPVMAGARICFYLSYEVNGLDAARRKKEGYRAQSVARAAENNIWYLQANGVGPFNGNQLSLGNSVMVDNSGVVVAEAAEMKPDILYADVELDLSKPQGGPAMRGQTGKLLGGWNKLAVEQLQAQKKGESYDAGSKTPGDSVIRLALMQAVPEKWDLKRNFDTFLKYLDDAKGADIFITPECWLDGYAAPDKTSTPEKLRTIAQDLTGSPYLNRVSEEARKRRMYICFGFTSMESGKIYNSAGLWDKSGRLVGIYHKTHLQAHDLQFEKGEGFPVWKTDWGTVGTMICADRRWPETARTLRLKGARLILNPTYGMNHLANEWWMRTRGYENQCYIAFAHPSIGFIVGPRGDLIAKRIESPGVLICDVDITLARTEGHIDDRRGDIYFK